MKRILVILLLLITFNSIAQNKTVVLKVSSSDISNYKLISDTGFNNGYTTRVRLKQGLDSLAATEKNVSDSLFNSGYTRRDRTKQGLDSVGVLKVNFTDTATMLSPYARNYSVVKYTDTSTMLSPYQRSFSAVKYTDTATMLSGYKTYYPRAALSAGTGITYNSTTGVITNASPSSGGTVTSVATNNGSGITGGTITGSGTIAADTAVLSTKANVTALLLGKVSSVTGTSPIVSSGGSTPAISIPAATTSVNGYLTSTDWTTFNNKASTASLANYLPLAGGTLTGALTGTSATFNVSSSGTNIEVLKLVNSGSGANTKAKLQFTAAGTNYGFIAGGYGASAPQMQYSVNSGGNHLFEGDGVQIVGYLTVSSLVNLASRLNVNGATDNSSYQLNVNGAANISANATFGGTVTLSAPTPILQFSNGTTAGLLYQAASTLRLSDNSGGFPFVYDFSDGSISVNATKSGYAAQINNLSTNGSGLLIVAGNTSSNYPLNVVDKTNTYNYLLIRGDGFISASSLVGTGNRMVVASSTGGLSTQAIPSGGGTDGTYTPTLTNVSNTSSLTGNNVTYTKVGSTYHISMLATITATTVGTCQFTISIPSTINNATQRSNGLAIGLNGEVGTLVYNSTTSLICKFVSLFASVPTTLSVEFDYSEN